MDQVTREVELDAPCEDVWDAITSREVLEDWFGAEVDGDIETGELVHTSDGRRAVIERADAPHHLTFRWVGEEPSQVDIAISPCGEGSRVRVVERRIETTSVRRRIGFEASLVRT